MADKPIHRDRPVPANPQTHRAPKHRDGTFVAANECPMPEDIPTEVY